MKKDKSRRKPAVKRRQSKSAKAAVLPARPDPAYSIGSTVKTPVSVFESAKASVVGCEWGPDRLYQKSAGWQYLISESGFGKYWRATEEEIRDWQAA